MSELVPAHNDRLLICLEEAKRFLAEAKTLEEVSVIRDKAQAVKAYAKRRDLALESINDAAEVKLRAERRMGELLRVMPKHPPGPAKRDRLHDAIEPPTLADLDIEPTQSMRCQRIAMMPKESFEQAIQEAREQQKEITTAGVLRKAEKQDRERRKPKGFSLALERFAVQDWLVARLESWPEEHQGEFVEFVQGILMFIDEEMKQPDWGVLR